ADRLEEENEILQRIRAGESTERFETVRLRKDGTPLNVSVNMLPIRDAEGSIVVTSAIIRNITETRQYADRLQTANEWQEDAIALLTLQQSELIAANARLESLATTDALTSLKNHRAFQEKLAQEFVR